METITVPYKGKSYDFNYYLTTFDNEFVFCFATPDHKEHPVIKSDFFFAKLNPFQPDHILISAPFNDKNIVALIQETVQRVVNRHLTDRRQARHN